ncbi:hypothetical protein [Natrinema sp. SYSU A 869]|uniref:hypothetical protein n=1 Tax=Natrinema sp. SYSU A 869 TaxID=2871694 RepID=UPI001CA4655B|nr:hypothetical protein [Natrinema sp. SYSU A 869]
MTALTDRLAAEGSSASPQLVLTQICEQAGRNRTTAGTDRSGMRAGGDGDQDRVATARAVRE